MQSHRKAFVLLVVLGLWPARASAAAGANPMIVEQPPPVHRFFDAKNIALQSINAIMLGADVVSTKRALQVPGSREANPLAQSQAILLTLKFAGVGAGWGIAYAMHKGGHHRAERLIPVIFGAPSAASSLHNYGIH
jgi:hypothetical protein